MRKTIIRGYDFLNLEKQFDLGDAIRDIACVNKLNGKKLSIVVRCITINLMRKVIFNYLLKHSSFLFILINMCLTKKS